MNKRMAIAVGVLLTGVVAWTAFAQPAGGGRGGFGRMREAQQKALAMMQEDLGKLKAMMEEQPAGGRNFQNMTEEERTKMMEEFRARREKQQEILASIQQQLDTFKGGMTLAREYRQTMQPLEEILASAKSENATATAAKIQSLIDQRQKEFEAKMEAMGYNPEMMQRMMERMNQMGQRGGRRGQ